MPNDHNIIVMGKIGAPYGVRGWLKLYSFTDPITNILQYPDWQLCQPKAKTWQAIKISDHQVHKDHLRIKIIGINDRDEAQTLTHANLGIYQRHLPPTDDDSYYWNDLIGLQVFNQHQVCLGTVDHLFSAGPNDVLVVIGDKQRHLIPFLKHTIHNIDIVQQRMDVEWALEDS